MGAAPSRFEGRGIADAPRGPGDENDLAGKILLLGHQPASLSSESFFGSFLVCPL